MQNEAVQQIRFMQKCHSVQKWRRAKVSLRAKVTPC